MLRQKKPWVIIFLVVLLLGPAACLPTPAGPITTPSSSATPVRLPPTWTEIPPTETPEPAQETAPPAIESPIPFPSELVPFKEISMVSTQEGWAFGSTADLNSRIWRTSDGGLSWVDVSPKPKTLDFIFALDSTTAWATMCEVAEDDCEASLARTTDGGETWSVLSDDRFYAYSSVRFFSQDRGLQTSYDVGAGSGFWYFYETNDGGSTWDRVEIKSDPEGADLSTGEGYSTCNMCGDYLYLDQDLLMDIDGNLNVQPMDGVPLFISFDRGASWQANELAFPGEGYQEGTFHPNRPILLEDRTIILPVNLASWEEENSEMVFYSSRDGQNWRVRSIVEAAGSIYSWNQFDDLSNGEIVFNCGSDLCVTRDGALTWERISANLSYTYSQTELYAKHFDFVDSQNGWALVGPTYGPFSLWRTSDGGRVWNQLFPNFDIQ